MSVAFDDPLGWGFCKYCAYEVAVDIETGQLLVHNNPRSMGPIKRCYGSLLAPTVPTPTEATPVTWEETVVEALNDDLEI